jgi:hypothetical protein
MRRREFVATSLVLAGWPWLPRRNRRAVRIGWIVGTPASASTPFLDTLQIGLADLGYAEAAI